MPRSSRASTERPFVKFANRILRLNAQSLSDEGVTAKKMGTQWVPPGRFTRVARELNLPRSSRASTERPFVKFANRILRLNAQSLSDEGSVVKKDGYPFGYPSFFGGATRNRTGDRGVADLCLTAWPWRHILSTDELYHKDCELSSGFENTFFIIRGLSLIKYIDFCLEHWYNKYVFFI